MAVMPWTNICFKFETQSNSFFEACSKEVIAIIDVSKILNGTRMKLSIIRSKVCSMSCHHFDLEVVISRMCIETHCFITFWGKFIPKLEDVLCTKHLPLFGDSNAMGCELKEDDHVRVNFLSIVMAASKSSRKFTYAS